MQKLDSDTKTQWRITYQSGGHENITAPMASQAPVARMLWMYRGYAGLSAIEETVVTTRRAVDPGEFVPVLKGGA